MINDLSREWLNTIERAYNATILKETAVMPAEITITLQRTSTDIEWPGPYSEAIQSHIQANYVETGKMLSITATESADHLTRTITRTFTDRTHWDEFKIDPIIAEEKAEKSLYIAEHGLDKDIAFNFS